MSELSVVVDSLADRKVGFIGGGNMAKAIAGGFLKKGILKGSQVYVSAPSESTLKSWQSYNVNTTHNNAKVIEECDIIFLAFKPYQLDAAIPCHSVQDRKLFVSMLVGVPNSVIYSILGARIQSHSSLIRIMPNIALAVGEGCVVMSPHEEAEPRDVSLIQGLFSCLGVCEIIPESLMESAAAVAGSGLAYIFMVIEALADGALKHGMPRGLAYTIAAQTVTGASKLFLQSDKHPGQLKDEVCSPGGTTICAVHELEKGGLRATFMNAVEAAVLKARDISAKAKK